MKNPAANAGDAGDMDAILGLGRSTGGRHGDQRSMAGCREEPGGMQRGAWRDAERSLEGCREEPGGMQRGAWRDAKRSMGSQSRHN